MNIRKTGNRNHPDLEVNGGFGTCISNIGFQYWLPVFRILGNQQIMQKW